MFFMALLLFKLLQLIYLNYIDGVVTVSKLDDHDSKPGNAFIALALSVAVVIKKLVLY